MELNRRTVAKGVALIAAHAVTGCARNGREKQEMYGLIGKITAADGKRDELAAILLSGTKDMPGCHSYVIAADGADPSALWVTEVWESADAHQASLTLPSVQDAISKGRAMIAGMDRISETTVLGGHGLPG